MKMKHYWNYLSYAKRMFWKRGMPLYLVYFITERCNAKCKHCLCGSGPIRTNDLSLEEIEKISKTMGNLLFLLPTGGEPFLREDIPQIVEIFYKNNHIQNAVIPTNGGLTQKVLDGVKRILDLCPGLDLGIDVSLDGIGENHNEVRQVKGLFDKTITTYKELRKLEAERKNLNVNIEVTVSTYNQDKLMGIYDYLRQNLDVATVFTLLTRGKPRDPVAKGVEIDKYEAFNQRLIKDMKESRLAGYSHFPFADFINAKRAVRHEIITRVVREKKQQVPCYAANLSAVLFSDGDLYPCELLDMKLGNLRESNYDFKKIWQSQRAEEIRKYIKDTKCFCTYECFLTNNILFNPRMLPRIFKEWISLKARKL